MNTSKNVSLIDKDFQDITVITPSKRNTNSEGGILKTGVVVGKARLSHGCASGCCRPDSLNLATLGKPQGPEEEKEPRGIQGSTGLWRRRLVQRSAASRPGEAVMGSWAHPQPYWVSLAGKQHPSKEKVGEDSKEQDTQREGGGRGESALH